MRKELLSRAMVLFSAGQLWHVVVPAFAFQSDFWSVDRFRLKCCHGAREIEETLQSWDKYSPR